jgi:putative DNA primase/helicase
MDLEINSENAQEPPTTWLKFLNDISNGRQDWIDYLQKVLGYCLTGDTSEQKIFFFYGDGANGKSTLCNVVRDIFGNYAKSVRPTIIANNNKNDSPDQANSELASLPNIRLALAEEGSQGVSLDEATVKQITGGTEISTRKLYADTFQFKPKFKLIMCTNHKPRISGNDYGIWRRVILIPFDRIFKEEEKDKTLADKLKKEYPQILNWIINGFYSWQCDGLDDKPQCIQDAISEYKDDENPLSDFTAICLKLDAEKEVKSGDLWKVYDLFCADEQIRNSISQTAFGKIIRALPGVKKTRKRDGIYYTGLTFTDRAIELMNPFDNKSYTVYEGEKLKKAK